jgi:hypothetical protein
MGCTPSVIFEVQCVCAYCTVQCIPAATRLKITLLQRPPRIEPLPSAHRPSSQPDVLHCTADGFKAECRHRSTVHARLIPEGLSFLSVAGFSNTNGGRGSPTGPWAHARYALSAPGWLISFVPSISACLHARPSRATFDVSSNVHPG